MYMNKETKLGKIKKRKEINISRKTGIPSTMKSQYENMTGFSLNDVRVHYNSANPTHLGALAYTQGNQIYLGPGQEKHLPHELGHVVQQKQGRVQETSHIGSVRINNNTALEREADKMGEAALQIIKNPVITPQSPAAKASEVAQFVAQQHAAFSEHRPIGNHPPSPAGKKPLMVFEVFGDKPDDLLNIYKQSCAYDGNTICIIGINKKVTSIRRNGQSLNPAQVRGEFDQAMLTTLQTDLEKLHLPNHQAYVVPFLWIPTQDKGGYDLPYYEVRVKLMEIANTLIAERREENQGDDIKVIYRWIDRDVTNDTSNAINRQRLSLLTKAQEKGEPMYLSAAYDWAADKADTPVFIRLLPELNRMERELRAYWFMLNRKYQLESQSFYLPEPTLLMNELAHIEAMGRLRQKHREADHRGQQRESEAAVGIQPKVKFIDQLHVTKPNKRMPGGARYLQKLSDFAERESEGSLEEFQRALQSTRQSAFNNGQWSFIGINPWNEWQSDEEMKKERLEYYEKRYRPKEGQALEERSVFAQYQLNLKRRELSRLLYTQI